MNKTDKHSNWFTGCKIWSLLIAGAFIFQIVTKTVYPHIHKLPDGTLVTHAHPYNKSSDSKPIKSHSHASSELILLQNLDFIIPFVFCFFALELILESKSLFKAFRQILLSNYLSLFQNKAPPLFSFF